jgi:hypothetical protein
MVKWALAVAVDRIRRTSSADEGMNVHFLLRVIS